MSLLKRPPKCPQCGHRSYMSGCRCSIESCACTYGIYVVPPKRRRKRWWQ